jgi:ATP-dependent Clp protease ATP-binding subunit ClpA
MAVTEQTEQTMVTLDLLMKQTFRHHVQGPVHVLMALIAKGNANAAGRLLRAHGVDPAKAKDLVVPMYEVFQEPAEVLLFTPDMKLVVSTATRLAAESGDPLQRVTTTQLLRAIIEVQDPNSVKLLDELGVHPWKLLAALKGATEHED